MFLGEQKKLAHAKESTLCMDS